MKSKVLTLALGGLLTLGVTAAATAQDNPPPPQEQGQAPGPGARRMDPDRQLQHMTRALDLTADQQSQIKPILVDRQQKMEAMFQDQSLSQEDRRAKMQSIRQDTRSRIEAVLNDQQKQKFESMEQRMGRRRSGMGGPAPDSSSPQPQ